MKKFSVGRQAAGAALGVATGLAFPFFAIFAQFVLVTPLLMTVLFAWSGLWGAFAAGASTALVCYYLGGAPGLLLSVVMLVLPGFLTIFLLRKRKRFFTGLKLSVLFHLASLILGVSILWLCVRGDIVDALIAEFRLMIDALPRMLVDQFLILLGRTGALGTSADFTASMLSYAQHDAVLSDLLRSLSSDLRLSLPSMLINTGVLTAILTYALPLRICQRRGDEPQVSLAPLRDWRLDANLTLCPSACAILSLIAFNLGLAGADSVYVVMVNLALLLFSIQGVAALERWMFRLHLTPGKRTALIVVFLLLLPVALRVAGFYSAFFGSKGVVTNYLKSRADRARNKKQ